MECDFYIKSEDGKYIKCTKNATKLIRCADCCITHYNYLLKDNKKRIIRGDDIPADFSTVIRRERIVDNLCVKEVSKPVSKKLPEEEVTEEIPESEIVDEESNKNLDKFKDFTIP